MDRELSTVSREDGASERDDRLTELVFAVPEVELERAADAPEPRWRVLPGPPLAFCQRSSVLYHDQDALLNWGRRRGAYPAGTIERWEAHFRSDAGASVQGLLSVPIIRYDDQDVEDERIPAVLNVHCNRAGFLKGRRVKRQLLPLLYPLVGVIHRLTSLLALVQDTNRETEAVVGQMTRPEGPADGRAAARDGGGGTAIDAFGRRAAIGRA
jgi:hypothetical protein